jgi:hypothetical protein
LEKYKKIADSKNKIPQIFLKMAKTTGKITHRKITQKTKIFGKYRKSAPPRETIEHTDNLLINIQKTIVNKNSPYYFQLHIETSEISLITSHNRHIRRYKT